MLKVLYDGWSWVYSPNSPAALHLVALLAQLPAEVQAQVALPGGPPGWFPENARPLVEVTADTPRARLAWEQRSLPQLAERLGEARLHLVTPTPALFGRARAVASPAGFFEAGGPPVTRGVIDRLRSAAAGGGMARLGALLWPSDLPVERQVISAGDGVRVERLPPLALPEPDEPGANLDLPEDYVLYHGPDHPSALRRLLEIWSWPAGPVGNSYPLLLLGLGEQARQMLPAQLEAHNLAETVRSLPPLAPAQVCEVYRKCTTLLHPAPISPWGDPVRQALAYGKPVVAADGPLADALAGPAAYLLPPDDLRAFGAAVITTIVEESIAGGLASAARQRASGWDGAGFGSRLAEVYQDLPGF